jgi:hypothetical protein
MYVVLAHFLNPGAVENGQGISPFRQNIASLQSTLRAISMFMRTTRLGALMGHLHRRVFCAKAATHPKGKSRVTGISGATSQIQFHGSFTRDRAAMSKWSSPRGRISAQQPEAWAGVVIHAAQAPTIKIKRTVLIQLPHIHRVRPCQTTLASPSSISALPEGSAPPRS